MAPRILPEATYLVHAHAPADRRTILHADARWADDDDGGGVTFNGTGHVQVPAVHMQCSEFSFCVSVKPRADQHHSMYLYSDWTYPYSFRTYLKPVHAGYAVAVDLRREVGPDASLLFVDDVPLVKPDQWSTIAVSWNGESGVCKIYINAILQRQVLKSKLAGSEMRVQGNNHATHQVGVKLDSSSDFFVGQMKNLSIAKEAISHFDALDMIGYETKYEADCMPTQLPFAIGKTNLLARRLIGEDSAEDADTVLEGDCVWGKNCVILRGRGGVKVPAVHFQDDDFTFGMWINPNGYTARVMTLYSDWKKWWSFLFSLVPIDEEEAYEVRVVLRRDIHKFGRPLVRLSGAFVKPNEWSFVAVSWDGKLGVCKIMVNGRLEVTGKRRRRAGIERVIQRNNHKTHEIGWSADGDGDYFVGRLGGMLLLKGAAPIQ